MEKPFKDKAQHDGSSSSDDVQEDEIQSIRRSPPLPTVFAPKVLIVATNLAAISLVEKSYWGTETLYLSTPIADGGLGLSPHAIGTFGSITAIVVGMSQLFIFPRVHGKWGSRSIYLLGVSASLPRFVLWPVMNWIARVEGPASLVLFALGFQVCCSALVEFACGESSFILQRYPERAFSCNLGFDYPVCSESRLAGRSTRLLPGALWLVS